MRGPAGPYLSDIVVADMPGSVTKVRVTMIALSHTFPDDIDVLLVGPSGATAVLMSDVGGGTDITFVTLTFDDDGEALPDAGLLESGTFAPTNFGDGDVFPAPAPAGPHGASLATMAITPTM